MADFIPLFPNSKEDPETGCRIWLKEFDKNGEPQTVLDGELINVRYSLYDLLDGPLPFGAKVGNICHNNRCVAIPHLCLIKRGKKNRECS